MRKEIDWIEKVFNKSDHVNFYDLIDHLRSSLVRSTSTYNIFHDEKCFWSRVNIVEFIRKTISEVDSRNIFSELIIRSDEDPFSLKNTKVVFVNKETIVKLELKSKSLEEVETKENEQSFYSLEVTSADRNFVIRLLDSISLLECEGPEPNIPPVEYGRVHMIMKTSMGPRVQCVGWSGLPLVRENYEQDVLEEYDKTVKDLKNDNPIGRLTIIGGAPGSGKTHMIKALLTECTNCRFLFIQPKTLEDLIEENMINAIVQEVNGTGPIVIVIEDADQCLSVRKAENMTSISSILNLSDGIIGDLFDLRIIATTNTPAIEFDKAITRRGRISSNIQVNYIKNDTIGVIWKSLTGLDITEEYRKLIPESNVVLADIYYAAKDSNLLIVREKENDVDNKQDFKTPKGEETLRKATTR